MDAAHAQWQVGDVIDDLHEVRQVIESGGMGLVHRVWHRDWGMELAVKTPRPELVSSLEQTSTREQRPGLAALLDYAREGDAIVVVAIDRLGRNASEAMTTIRELGERGIVLRSLREGIDTSNATARMVAGVLASLAELELELGRERRSAAREARRARGQSIGRSANDEEPFERLQSSAMRPQ
jgi:DNA invertase Pin-like site-specific DNA recombinase